MLLYVWLVLLPNERPAKFYISNMSGDNMATPGSEYQNVWSLNPILLNYSRLAQARNNQIYILREDKDKRIIYNWYKM